LAHISLNGILEYVNLCLYKMDKKKLLILLVALFIVLTSFLVYFYVIRDTEVIDENQEQSQQDGTFPLYEGLRLIQSDTSNEYFYGIYVSDSSVEDIKNYYKDIFPELQITEIDEEFVTLSKLTNPSYAEMLQIPVEERNEWIKTQFNSYDLFITWIDIVPVEGNRDYLRGSLDTIDDLEDSQTVVFHNYFK